MPLVRFLYELSERELAAGQLREFHVLVAGIGTAFAENAGALMKQFVSQLQSIADGGEHGAWSTKQELKSNRLAFASAIVGAGGQQVTRS